MVGFSYESLPDKIETQPPALPPPTSFPFFWKRNKDDKQKQNRHEQPSKTFTDAGDLKNRQHSSTSNDDDHQRDKEKLSEKISEKIKKLGLDFFAEDFEGVTVSSTKCLSCETITEQKETMIDLSVPITGYENMDTVDNPDLFIQVSFVIYVIYLKEITNFSSILSTIATNTEIVYNSRAF